MLVNTYALRYCHSMFPDIPLILRKRGIPREMCMRRSTICDSIRLESVVIVTSILFMHLKTCRHNYEHSRFSGIFLGTFDELWSAMSHINNVKIRFCDES